MVNCPHCHTFIEHPTVDHWIDFLHERASVVCPHCMRSFEVWAQEL